MPISTIIRQDVDRLARLDEPSERLLVGLIVQAIQDADQRRNAKLKAEATEFLWTCCPRIAERAGLRPRPA